MPKIHSVPQRTGMFERISQSIRWPKVTRKLTRKKFASYISIHDDPDRNNFEASSEVTAIAYPENLTIRTSLTLYARAKRLAKITLARLKPTKFQTSNNDPVDQDSRIPPPIYSTFALAQSSSSMTPTPATTAFSGTLPDAEDRMAQDRAIITEQDAAYKLSSERDQERISAIIAANKLAAELEARVKEMAEEAMLRRQEAEARRQAQIAWRRWARRALVPAPPESGGIKIAVRLPCGTRRVARLPSSASLDGLYTLVETFLIPNAYTVEDDPEEAPEDYEHHSSFALVTTNSRIVFPNVQGVRVDSLDVMRGGALVIVELLAEGVEDESEDDEE